MKKHLVGPAVVIGLLIASPAWSQTTRDVQAPKAPAPRYQSHKETKSGIFKIFTGKQKGLSNVEDQEAYEKRMKKTAKEKAKVARKMDDPQYSDPLYFGHKRPPKKRKNGKKKFCKECGMTH